MNYPISLTKVAWETNRAIEQGYRIIVNQGGTRSGKTYSITDVMIALAYSTSHKISITSLSLPHLKKGAMRDWQTIMDTKGEYDRNQHNKTDLLYNYPLGSYIEFFSLDESKKVRGPSRDILFINEANLIDQETWRQLLWRTKVAVVIDYNPADEFHWIYDEVLPREDCKFIQSTYRDNPFLSVAQKQEIERLKDLDTEFWKVYGLGERGTSTHTIYPKFELFNEWPDIDYCFGLDFGFTHPNALAKVGIDEDDLFLEEMLYEPGLPTPQLIERIKPIVGHKYVYCDSARPEIIHEMTLNGINAYPVDKYEGSVKDGIDFMRSKRKFVHRSSVNMQKEMRAYKWKQKPNGQMVDEPVKVFDDLMDAARYGSFSFRKAYAPIHISKH